MNSDLKGLARVADKRYLGYLAAALLTWLLICATPVHTAHASVQAAKAQAKDQANFIQAEFIQVVYLAETHTDTADHRAQLEIVQALAEQAGLEDREVAIALEMFQRPFQPALDAYLAGEMTESELMAQSEYETRWGYDWEFYAPILRYAKAEKIAAIALNTPTEITRKVADSGLNSLSPADFADIPPLADIDIADPAYRTRMVEAFEAHGGVGNSLGFENFFAAQVLWDETMADRIVQQLIEKPAQQVIVLVGEGHVAYNQGIVSRVARRLPDVKQLSIRLMPIESEVEPGFADAVWFTSP